MENIFETPIFLFAENPIKTGDFQDQRQFILHKGSDLIEIVSHPEFLVFDESEQFVTKPFDFFDEHFILIWRTKTTFDQVEQISILDAGFNWFREYLIWEDTKEFIA